MLAITDTAAEAIKSLTLHADLPPTGGLRIASVPRRAEVELSMAGSPALDDLVVDGDAGVHVFVEPAAALVLQDTVLDVVPADDGSDKSRFALVAQR